MTTNPEQGQLVKVRERFYLVQDVVAHQSGMDDSAIHRVTLECVDDDRLDEQLDVIWEREVDPQVFDAMDLPAPTHWDQAQTFDAFLHAIRWSSSSMLAAQSFQSPFRAAIEIDEYQLEPVARALTMPRANLLIADDVGLGKTIEAGLVMQEMIARRTVRRIMVVCPASLQQQWQEEMQQKFQLRFEIIDRAAMQRLRKEYGIHVNPWNSFPRLITSMDFLKREQPLRLFEESLQREHNVLRDWDLLIIDEAHNVTPAGRTNYIRDSDRTRMTRSIVDHFEHRLFLTVTPHNGFTESFTALLEMLDPLRFSRGSVVDPEQVDVVMVRRLKEEITDALGRRKFPLRHVEQIPIGMGAEEQLAHDDLRQYTRSRMERIGHTEKLPINFALTMLKKRLLSSPLAFARSMETHLQTLGTAGGSEVDPDARLVEQLAKRAAEDWDDDSEKSQVEEDALREATRFFSELTPEEQALLKRMADYAYGTQAEADSKARVLLQWTKEHLYPDGRSNNERLIIFTEYLDTLEYLQGILSEYSDAIMTLSGGLTTGKREEVKAAFQTSPDENAVRILLATDAASEGLNLQNYCRYLIHYEIPWNPNRMEQRNGRIDRHGQPAEEVFVFHFVDDNDEDSRFLQTVVDKVQQMRADLGSVGEIIAKQIEEKMLGRRPGLDLPEERRKRVHQEVRTQLMTDLRVQELKVGLRATRHELELEPENLAMVLHEALILHRKPGLEPVDERDERAGFAYWLRELPASWHDAEATLFAQGRKLAITFDHDKARQRSDVALIHLDHPLMNHAIGTFRANLWSANLHADHQLNRVSYRVLPHVELASPVVIAWGRLIATSKLSQKLHEGLVMVGGEFKQGELYPYSDDNLRDLLAEPYEYPSISKSVADGLRRFYPSHRQALLEMLRALEQSEAEHLEQLAAERAGQEAAQIQELMRDRVKELRARITDTKDRIPPSQLKLFDRDEYLQYEEDTRWLERKLVDLQERLKTEPQNAHERYRLRSVRVFPLGLLYLLPDRLIE